MASIFGAHNRGDGGGGLVDKVVELGGSGGSCVANVAERDSLTSLVVEE